MLARFLRAVAILFGLLLSVCAVMFVQNRPALYYAACEVGLPNASRPVELSARHLDCTILGEKQVFSGLIFAGYHGMNIRLNGRTGGVFKCPEGGCDPSLTQQLALPGAPHCLQFSASGFRMASIELEGWQSIYPTEFGHMNRQPTVIYARRILKVGPPPANVVDDLEAHLRTMNLCE
jgi:hypothetical protein